MICREGGFGSYTHTHIYSMGRERARGEWEKWRIENGEPKCEINADGVYASESKQACARRLVADDTLGYLLALGSFRAIFYACIMETSM